MTSKPDPELEGLIFKLGDTVSEKYPRWLIEAKGGYAAQQKMIDRWGYRTFRWALTYVLDQQIVPQGKSPYPLLDALCRTKSEELNDG